MPCCALAAFIFGQIVLGFDAFKRFVLRRPLAAEPARSNPATEWMLFSADRASTVAPIAPARRLSFRWLIAASALELALAAGAVYGVRAHQLHANDPSRAAIECRRGGFWLSR